MSKRMSSRERLLAAMRHEEVDRIPLSPRMGPVIGRYYKNGGIWAYKKFKREYFDCDPTMDYHFPVPNPFYGCQATLNYLNNVNVSLKYDDRDDYFLVTRNFETPAGHLTDKTILPKPDKGFGPMPHKKEYMIKEPADLEKIHYILPPLKNINFAEYHRWIEEMGSDGLVLLNIPGVMDYWGGDAYSMENMMIAYYEQPDFFNRLVKLFGDYSIEKVQVALENGIKNFFLVNFYISLSSGWSPTIIEEKFAPIIKKQVEMIHKYGGLVDYYDDGRLMQSAEIFVRAEVDVLETCSPAPVGDFRLSEAKKRWGDRVTFKGLVDMLNIVAKGTPQDIDAHIRDVIQQNGNEKHGIILGTMDSILVPETTDKNIAAYFTAANKYR